MQVLFDCPRSTGEVGGGGFNIGTLTPVRFSVVKGGAKSSVVNISLCLQGGGGAYTRALKGAKSLSPPIPVGGGAVDTND